MSIRPSSATIPRRHARRPGAQGADFSGGPSSVYDQRRPCPMAHFQDGRAYSGNLLRGATNHPLSGRESRTRAKARIWQRHADAEGRSAALFAKPDRLQIWNSHGDKLTRLPKGFRAVAASDNSEFAAIEDTRGISTGCNFTPKSPHAARAGNHRQFRPRNLRLRGEWTMRHFIEQAVEEIRRKWAGNGSSWA